jgi:hypothetical protein
VARIRTIKPEFFTSEDIVSLRPLTRLLYIAIWCEADKEGRLAWKPLTFKLRYFPGDECDIQAMCQEIVDSGLVVLYGEGYGVIPTFKAHQHINPRESESNLPEPVAITTRKARVATRQPRDSDAQVGREGKGKEGKGKEDASNASRFPEFWAAWPKSERKQDRGVCETKWIDRKLDSIADLILADIATKKKTQKWQGGYIEAPEVYINRERWKDGVTPDEPEAAGALDPDSRPSIEAEGIARGIGPWDEMKEQWHVYKARVRGPARGGLDINALAKMAAQRQQEIH